MLGWIFRFQVIFFFFAIKFFQLQKCLEFWKSRRNYVVTYLLFVYLRFHGQKKFLKKIFWSIQLGNTKLLMVVKRSIITTTIFNAKNHKKCIKILNIPAISHCKKNLCKIFSTEWQQCGLKNPARFLQLGPINIPQTFCILAVIFPWG